MFKLKSVSSNQSTKTSNFTNNFMAAKFKLAIVVGLAAFYLTACGALENLVKSSDANSANRSATNESRVANDAPIVSNPSAVNAGDSRYERAFNKLRGASSYHFILKTDVFQSKYSDASHSEADGVYEARRRAWQFNLSRSDNNSVEEWIKINSTNKNYLKKNGTWTTDFLMPAMDDVSIDLVQGVFAPSRPDMKRIGLPPTVGVENIEGEQCEHYHFEISEGMFKGTYDAYLSKSSGEFVRFNVSSDTNKHQLSIDKLNEPVSIVEPR